MFSIRGMSACIYTSFSSWEASLLRLTKIFGQDDDDMLFLPHNSSSECMIHGLQLTGVKIHDFLAMDLVFFFG